MPANVESMFSLRKTPWHGIGTIVEKAPNSDEALKVAGLDWEVLSRPVHTGGYLIEGYKANVRSSDNFCLGIVTDQYKIVQNREAFTFTNDLLATGEVRYETAGSLNSGRKVWMLAQMPDSDILGDKIENYLVFTNNHDGRGSIRVAITPIRVVCQNTLNLALSSASRMWSTIHTGDLQAKMDEAKRTLELAKDYVSQLSFTAEELANKQIADSEVSDYINTLIAIPEKASDKVRESVVEMRKQLAYRYFKAPDLEEFKGTGWGLINAVSDFATHLEPRRKTPTYKENLFDKVVNGHPLIDSAYDMLKKAS